MKLLPPLVNWYHTRSLQHRTLLKVLTLTALVAITYANTLPNQLVWDDEFFLHKWTAITKPSIYWRALLLGDVPMSYGQVYRPIRSLMYIISTHLYNSNIVLYHMQAILIHAGITLLIAKISSIIWKNEKIGFITALIFAVHPIHVEAVTWITASFDTIGIAFMFMSLLLFLLRQQYQYAYVASIITAGIAFFTYELTFVLLPILFLIQVINTPELQKSQLTHLIPYFIIMCLYGTIRLIIPATSTLSYPAIHHNLGMHLLYIFAIIGKYLTLVFIPGAYSANHYISDSVSNLYYVDRVFENQISGTIDIIMIRLLVICTIYLFLTYYAWWRNKQVFFALASIAVGLIPILQFIPQNSLISERYAYIASWGACMLIAYAITRIKSSKIQVSLLVLLIVFAISQTLARNQLWQSNVTLWDYQYHLTPNSSYINQQRAAAIYNQGDVQTAIELYQQALALQPNDVYNLTALGYILYHQGRPINAESYLLAAHQLNPKDPKAILLLADVYFATARYNQALEWYTIALSINPTDQYIQEKLNHIKTIQAIELN